MRLIVVSGQSGAGKSVALRVLEDLGYYCVDNLPLNLLDAFIKSVQGGSQNVAVSIDIRNLPKDPGTIEPVLEDLKRNNEVSVLFLDASADTLLKRYSETRRIHPLSLSKEKPSLALAIETERKILGPLKEQSDHVIDSSKKSIHELSELVRTYVEGHERKKLVMVFQSFGFKYGLPTDADYVFDVRFLPNPHWEPDLRPLTGLEAPIKSFLEGHPEVIELKLQIQKFIEYWLPMLEKSNRSYLTVAIGCTGGKHRSVYIAQQLGEYFAELGNQVQIHHNTLEQSHS
ncbi:MULTISPECIES: RNase adapter RapZ [Vibrio]|uniref:RNase adapter RapZ n=2 Tax=Vibrio TaxID=662 RepID=A0A7X4LIH8_9VIBR|nr:MULTISPECIES: RNase adapter RapZ [Vibrio]MBF9001696.1 RNase adapter RapZ [Vibrio nitrifigilis]MZI92390.1 RNase adapter RapZ [Vibrio eleionomae]